MFYAFGAVTERSGKSETDLENTIAVSVLAEKLVTRRECFWFRRDGSTQAHHSTASV